MMALMQAWGRSIFHPYPPYGRENPRGKQLSEKWMCKKKTRGGRCLNFLKTREASRTDLLFHRSIRGVKVKLSSKSVGPVVLISSSIGESDGSKSNKNSEDCAFLHTLPYGGTESKWDDPWPRRKPMIQSLLGLTLD